MAVIVPAEILFLAVMPDIAPLSQLACAIEYITHPALLPLAEPASGALIHRPGLRLQVAARRILHNCRSVPSGAVWAVNAPPDRKRNDRCPTGCYLIS
ncbi:hypothetical protein UA44_24275 [Klebsiella aerogenes]|nr:hypothetical protein UA44_24275 [Klebsiella aerogenes]